MQQILQEPVRQDRHRIRAFNLLDAGSAISEKLRPHDMGGREPMIRLQFSCGSDGDREHALRAEPGGVQDFLPVF
ncbi:hypothetical protein [Comamonas composti]|uniref:hypothetical protein n=1 Tax=Comamonas composti TaxID=408558 RepID=UPI00047B9E68|nr:hypothetical protein [Comamonas composti]